MPGVWNLPLADLENQLNPVDRPNCFDVNNTRYCLNLIQASSRWAHHNKKGVGYPSFYIHDGTMDVMCGIWTEESGGLNHNTFQDLAVTELENYGLEDPNDFTADGILKWARATNRMADEGHVSNGACAFITGEYATTAQGIQVRGSQALRTRVGSNADSYYQATDRNVKQAELESVDPDFQTMGWRFDIWTRAIYLLTKADAQSWPTNVAWSFPNYERSSNGNYGCYTTHTMTLRGPHN